MGVPSKLVIKLLDADVAEISPFLKCAKTSCHLNYPPLEQACFHGGSGQGFSDGRWSHVFDFVENFHEAPSSHAAHGLHKDAVGVMLNNYAASQLVR